MKDLQYPTDRTALFSTKKYVFSVGTVAEEK